MKAIFFYTSPDCNLTALFFFTVTVTNLIVFTGMLKVFLLKQLHQVNSYTYMCRATIE